MKAGEINRLVAKDVMGWPEYVTGSGMAHECWFATGGAAKAGGRRGSFDPSTSISDAMMGVAKLRAEGWEFGMLSETEEGDGELFDDVTSWRVNAYHPDRGTRCLECHHKSSGSVSAEAPTLEHALSLTLLKAVGVEV